MTRFLAITRTEMLILRRNRWLLVATLIMVLFALALTFAGSAPTGTLGVDLLTVSVASMTTLSVYLAPLLALMISFDAIAGDVDRGSLSLLLSYPAGRGEIMLGKFTAHLAALAFAMTVGFGTAGAVAAFFGGAGPESLMALARLILTSILLGAVFLALGYLLSALARGATAAAGLSAGLWLVFVVLYDLSLLGGRRHGQGRHLHPIRLSMGDGGQPGRRISSVEHRRDRRCRYGIGNDRGRAGPAGLGRACVSADLAGFRLCPCTRSFPEGRAMKRLCLIALLVLSACKEEVAEAPDPVDLTPDALSFFCQMNIAEHGGPKGQIHLEGYPTPLFFAQVRDMVAYLKSPERDAKITAIYVSDMSVAPNWQRPGVSNWIAADGATFVVGANVAGGMGAREVVPFSNPKDAASFAEAYGGSTMPLPDIPEAEVLGPVDLDLLLETPS